MKLPSEVSLALAAYRERTVTRREAFARYARGEASFDSLRAAMHEEERAAFELARRVDSWEACSR